MAPGSVALAGRSAAKRIRADQKRFRSALVISHRVCPEYGERSGTMGDVALFRVPTWQPLRYGS